MTLDMYLTAIETATLPNLSFAIAFVGLMVMGGLGLNALAWLYTSMVEAELHFDANLDTIDALYARLQVVDSYLPPWDSQPAIMALVENNVSTLPVGEIPAYMLGWPEWQIPYIETPDSWDAPQVHETRAWRIMQVASVADLHAIG